MHKLILAVYCLNIPVSAGIGADLENFFKSAGMSHNVTKSGSYSDQTGGYYTGGSLVARNQVRNAQLATVQMPGFKAGCGGIDLWAGGFSHISSEQIVEMLRNIGSSAASYAFMLAIQTVSPQIYNIMNELNNLATQINQTNINSCETAATMLGGLWPKSDQASQHLCRSMGSQLGSFSDYAAARHGCGIERDKVFSKKGSEAKYKDMLVGEFNLAWKAIQKNQFLSADLELAELFMTLVGTIINMKSGDGFAVLTLPAREEVLSGLLHGGVTQIYKCNEKNDCLTLQLTKITVDTKQALLTRVSLILESLINKIYNDTEASAEEIAFLNATRLPVYKMLNVTTAFRKGYAPVDIQQYCELIAMDILYRYVMEVIDIVQDSVVQLKSVQVEDAQVERFLNQLREVRERITIKRQSAYQHMDNMLSFIQTTQLIEKQLHVMLGTLSNEEN